MKIFNYDGEHARPFMYLRPKRLYNVIYSYICSYVAVGPSYDTAACDKINVTK